MKKRFITTYGQKVPKLLKSLVHCNIIVIVEDFISAIRLHQNGYNVICLYGTKAPYSLIDQLFIAYDKVLVWLDNDVEKQTNSGQEAAKVILNLGADVVRKKYGFSDNKEIMNIVTTDDPKIYTNSEIKNFVQGALNG